MTTATPALTTWKRVQRSGSQPMTHARGKRYLMLASFHGGGILGSYRILQKWIFYEDGVIRPSVASAGLNTDRLISHRHHAYWRLDFDINGAFEDIVLEHFITGTSRDRDEGFGLGWSQIPSERTGRRI